MVAGHPLMLQYAQERGPRICSEGSLLAVRDFIVRQCGYDVGERGVESIRQGVCCCARKIAAMTHEDLLALKESVGASVTNSELGDSSVVDWKLLVEDKVRHLLHMYHVVGIVFGLRLTTYDSIYWDQIGAGWINVWVAVGAPYVHLIVLILVFFLVHL